MSTQNEEDASGGCYCGEVRFLVAADTHPLVSGYCHCESCRRAHAAPLYQVAWIPASAFRVTRGDRWLKWYTHSEITREHLHRHFCANCGTRVFNTFDGPFNGQQLSASGIFPTLFDDQALARSERWAPRVHMHCEDSLIDLSRFDDGLPKLPRGADAP
ncbi:MAG: GFA family protein [Gammaproteobacteria bacterium]